MCMCLTLNAPSNVISISTISLNLKVPLWNQYSPAIFLNIKGLLMNSKKQKSITEDITIIFNRSF